MRRYCSALLISLALASCGEIDRLLEAEILIPLSVTLDSIAVTIPQGGERTLAARVTPAGDLKGAAVSLTPLSMPPGVTVEVKDVASDGKQTTATVSVRVGASTAIGQYELKLIGKAAHATTAIRVLMLTVIAPPAYTVSLAKSVFTIASGGIAPLTVQLSRTNFTQPVTFSIDSGPAGITTTLNPGGVSGVSATANIVVASSVAAGSYSALLRGSATGLADRTVPLTVTVTSDAIQLIPTGDLTTPQAATVSTDLVVNRGAGVGAVTLSAEGLPTGVSATFNKPVTTDPTVTLTLAMGPLAESGAYNVTVRAQASGVADATTSVKLTVTDASIAVSLTPQSTSVFQGATVNVALAIVRTQFTGSVSVAVSGAPTGLTVTPLPASTLGSSATLRVQATASAVAGTYDLSVAVAPAGLAAAKTQVAALTVAVRAAPTGGNVLLDWTACGAPPWIAMQNGTGPWTQVLPVGDIASFTVNLGRGGYAWADGGRTVNVRFATQTELTAAPIQMCPTVDGGGVKFVTGTAVHGLVTEQWSYLLGGGTGTSTGTSPNFTIFGVRAGTHDLIATGTTALLGARAIIRRDLDPPAGTALESVNLAGPEGVSLTPRTLLLNGTFVGGDQITYALNYLTTAACVENRLASGGTGTSLAFSGLPDAVQRPDDFHEFVVTSSGTLGVRTSSVAFHTAANRTVTLPGTIGTPTVTNLAGAAYKRLQLFILAALPAVYNGSALFTFSQDAFTVTIGATIAYTGTSVLLAMPDFSAVGGWSPSFTMPSSARGSWLVTVVGSSGAGSRCTDGRTAVQATRTGLF